MDDHLPRVLPRAMRRGADRGGVSVRRARGLLFLPSVPGDPAGVERLAGRMLPLGRWEPDAFRRVRGRRAGVRWSRMRRFEPATLAIGEGQPVRVAGIGGIAG